MPATNFYRFRKKMMMSLSVSSLVGRGGAAKLSRTTRILNIHNTTQRRQQERRFFSSSNYSVHLSSIIEPPLDSNVIEKPCTVILFEDLSLLGRRRRRRLDDLDRNNKIKKQTNASSWKSDFQRRIPEEYGMSFGYLSFQQEVEDDDKENTQDTESSSSIISDCVTSMKFSNDLSTISDIVLISRGPISSLCAQYYLESCSLLGLIMVDPILVFDDDNNESDSSAIQSIVSKFVDTEEDRKRFHNSRLLLEPNAVPMMVVLSSQQQDDDNVGSDQWRQSSRKVAQRHSDRNGLYGEVPIIDMKERLAAVDRDNTSTTPNMLIDIVNDWTDDTL